MEYLLKFAGYEAIQSSVESAAKAAVTSESPAGRVNETINFLTPANLFSNDLVSGLVSALDKSGVPVLSTTNAVLDKVHKGLKDKGTISDQELKSMIYGVTGEPPQITEAFYRSEAFEKFAKKQPKAPSTSVLGRALNFINPFSRSGFLGGLLFGLIKWTLIGAGLLAGGVVVKKLWDIHKDKDKDKDKTPSNPQTPTSSSSSSSQIGAVEIDLPLEKKLRIKGNWPGSSNPTFPVESSWGTEYFDNDDNELWVVALDKPLPQQLLSWANQIYPHTQSLNSKLKNSPAFNKVVSIMRKGVNPHNPNRVIVPMGAHSIKEIVDMFVGEVEHDEE